MTDLTVSPATGLQSGANVVVQWQDSNTGDQPTTGSWYDYLTVTNTTTSQTLLSQPIFANATAGTVAAGGSLPEQYSFKLADGPTGTGTIQFSVTTDYFNSIAEFNAAGTGETNNTCLRAGDVHRGPLPHADRVQRDRAGTDRGRPGPGARDVDRDEQRHRAGNRRHLGGRGRRVPGHQPGRRHRPVHTNPHRRPRLRRSLPRGRDVPAAARVPGPLPPARRHRRPERRLRERRQVRARQPGAEPLRRHPDAFYADLVVSSVTPPPLASSGQPVAVTRYTVANQGIGTTNTSEWSDHVQLASDAAGQNIVADLGYFDHLGTLAVGGSYTHTVTPTLPNGLSGTFYLVVTTGGPYEFIYTTNDTTVSGPFTVTETPAPARWTC